MGTMSQLSSGKIFKKRSAYALRVLCLAGALISFCFLFSQADIGLNPSKIESNDIGAALYAGSPFFLQINVRYNQSNLIDCIKNRKIASFYKLQAAAGNFTFSQDQPLSPLAGFNSVVKRTFKLRCLLLDLPPPSILLIVS
jgi:hypothetical protein